MNRVRISVANENARSAVEAVIAANGIPAAAVRVEVGERVSKLVTLQDWFAHPVGCKLHPVLHHHTEHSESARAEFQFRSLR
jgi:hypothetical protein